MNPEEVKQLQETYASAPINVLIAHLDDNFRRIEETLKEIGLGGKLADSIIDSKLLIDEVYSRFFARHHLSLKLEDYIG